MILAVLKKLTGWACAIADHPSWFPKETFGDVVSCHCGRYWKRLS